jgi:hypothetical protein
MRRHVYPESECPCEWTRPSGVENIAENYDPALRMHAFVCGWCCDSGCCCDRCCCCVCCDFDCGGGDCGCCDCDCCGGVGNRCDRRRGNLDRRDRLDRRQTTFAKRSSSERLDLWCCCRCGRCSVHGTDCVRKRLQSSHRWTRCRPSGQNIGGELPGHDNYVADDGASVVVSEPRLAHV